MLPKDHEAKKVDARRKIRIPERSKKRHLKSYYYDKETHEIGRAGYMPTKPSVRPNRYIFIGQFNSKSITSLVKILFFKKGIRHPDYTFHRDGSMSYKSRRTDLPF